MEKISRKCLAIGMVLAVLAPAFGADKSIAVVVLKNENVKQKDLLVIADAFAKDIAKLPGYRVAAWENVTKTLDHLTGGTVTGCETDKCIAEIGEDLGMDMVLSIIAKLSEDACALNIRVTEVGAVASHKNVWQVIPIKDKPDLGEIPGLVQRLLGTKDSAASVVVEDIAVTPDTATAGMAFIEGQTFTMGSYAGPLEQPEHLVYLKSFYIDKKEVTQEQFEGAMGYNPSFRKSCIVCPVERVTWFEAKKYCEKMGKRLPTEAEWECATRGKTMTKYFWGKTIDDKYNWYAGNSGSMTHEVGTTKPNQNGLYDMTGNVREWCMDVYGSYTERLQRTPAGPKDGIWRIVRGGSWNYMENNARSAYRSKALPQSRYYDTGFRCASSGPQKK